EAQEYRAGKAETQSVTAAQPGIHCQHGEKAERYVADEVRDHVEYRDGTGEGRSEESERRQAPVAPTGERVQARVDHERYVRREQIARQGRGLPAGHDPRMFSWCQLRKLRLVDRERIGAEKRKRYSLDRVVLLGKPGAFAHGDPGGALHGIPVNAATDGGKGDGADVVRESELEAAPVAGGEQLRLAARPAVPDGADGVDHVLRRQPIAARDLRVAGGAAAERSAFAQQFRPRGAVDCAVDPAAPEQAGIRRVDDGVHRETRDV